MAKHSVWIRLLSLTLGLMLVFSFGESAVAAEKAADPLKDLKKADNVWDHFPSSTNMDKAAVNTYTMEGNWSFASAPEGTTNFTTMTDMYYIPRYETWSIASGIEAAGGAGDVRWVAPQFLMEKSVMYSVSIPAFVYTAPVSGTIKIGAAEKISVDWWKDGPNGMRIAIYKSNQYGIIVPIWPVGERWVTLGGSKDAVGTSSNKYEFQPIEICIQEGEKLYFVMDSNGSEADDKIFWQPTVAYVNAEYNAENDPALAMPEAAVLSEVVPYDKGAADNTYEHGNNWRLDYAKDDSYTAMDTSAWTDAWNCIYFYSNIQKEKVDWNTIIYDYGLIKSTCWADADWHYTGIYLQPAADGNDVAYSYKAPRDGVLKLSMSGSFAQDAAGNQISLAVYKNNIQIWPMNEDYVVESDGTEEIALTLPDVTTAVHAGDELHIRASLVTGIGDYWLKVEPSAEYTSLEYDAEQDEEYKFRQIASYSLKEQFSTTSQGVGNWYYLYAPIDENEVAEIPGFYEWAWCAGVEDYNVPQVYEGPVVLPGTMYDAVIAFKAPYIGTLKFYMEDTIKLDDSTYLSDAGDGCYYSVQLSSDGVVTSLTEPVYVANGATSEFEPLTLDVKKNEYIYFRVTKGAQNWHDTLIISPAIQYITLDEEDVGIADGQEADRTEAVAGSTLDETAFPMTANDYANAEMYSMTAAELTEKVITGDLNEGAVYEVIGRLSFSGITEDAVYDLKGICIKASGISAEANTGALTLKNFTLDIIDSDADAVNISECASVTLENVEIKGTTTGYAVYVANGRDGAETLLNACRIDGSFGGGAVVFNGNAGGIAAGTPQMINSFIRNTAAAAVVDLCSSGAFLLNNKLEGSTDAVQFYSDDAVLQSNEISGNVILFSGNTNTLVALNEVTGNITAENSVNTVILMNEAVSVTAVENESLTLVKNTVSGNVSVEKTDYLLVQDNNISGSVSTADSTNTYGDDLYDPTVRAENGVNEELLSKTNVEVFAGMTHKTDVRTADSLLKLKNYLNKTARTSTYAIVPPGLYTAEALSLAGIENYNVYAYGVAVEFASYEGSVFTMNNCAGVSVYGLYISHINNANGQATIIEKGKDYVIAQADPGYLQDLTDTAYYSGDASYVQGFRPNETVPYADIGFKSITYLGGGKHKCVFSDEASKELEVGGKISKRGNGTSVVVLTGCGNIRFEDVSIISGAGFGFQERDGDGGTQLYRVAITPKAAPILAAEFDVSQYSAGLTWTDDEGRLRGPKPLLSTCDATHSTNMRKGPQVVNCLFEKMTDDATNVNGEFGKVTAYDAATRKLTYTKGDNMYEGLPANFKTGDTAVLFTRGGKLLAKATVTEEPASGGWQVYVLTLDQDVAIESGTLIENLSANGAGFLFDNCLVDTTRSRGFLVKAPDGTINNCTIRNVGMAAILVKPEIEDGWNECGYSQNLTITNNIFENTGFYRNRTIYAPIAISGDGQFTSDTQYLLHDNILIQNNVIKNRSTDYAVYVNSAQNVKILGNDFGTKKDGMSSCSVSIDGANNVEIADNAYSQDDGNIEVTAQTRQVYGADMKLAPIGDYALVTAASVYTTEGWQVELTITNVSAETNEYTLAFADSTSNGFIAEGTEMQPLTLTAGETRKLYFPIETFPGDMTPMQSYAQTDIFVSIPSGSNGIFKNQVTFNGALKVSSEKNIDWPLAPAISKEGTDRTEFIASVARFAWDLKNLYMKVVVTDNIHYDCQNLDEFWDWDSLQIGLIPNREEMEQYAVFFVGLIKNKAKLGLDVSTIDSFKLTDITASVTRDDAAQTTTYLLTIPWTTLGLKEPGTKIGFEIVVNDRDDEIKDGVGPQRWSRYYIEYYGGIGSEKNRSLYGTLTLLDEPTDISAAQ